MTDARRQPRDRYSTVAIALHWLIAAAILFQVSLSGRMDGPHTPTSFAVTQLHKSVGISILLLSLFRLIWRLMNPPPPLPAAMPAYEKLLAQTVHVGLYVIMIGMPLTGWLMVSTSKIVIPTLLFGTIPWPDIPVVGHLAPAAKQLWRGIGHDGHHLLAKLLYVLVGLHVAGALKHQFFDRDETVLGHMLPGAVPGRWQEPRIFVVILAVVVVGGFGKIVLQPTPTSAGGKASFVAPAVPATPAPVAPVAAPPAAPSPTSATAPSAAPAPAASPAPTLSAPVRWLTTAGSSVGFATTWSGQAIAGQFSKFTADISFSPDALDASKVKVVIDIGSVSSGDSQRDASLVSDDWFDTAKHPTAIFTATRFAKTSPDHYVAHGTLDLRGVKKPVDLAFTLHIAGDKADMSGVTSLDRTTFGVGQGEWSSTDQIPAKVTVKVVLKAKRG